MARLTTDRTDPELGHGSDDQPVPQQKVYLVMSEDEIAKGYVRPVRTSYIHLGTRGGCGAVTRMSDEIARTYAANPHFYGATYCVQCQMHRPVGEEGEFAWLDDSLVGT